MIRKYTSYVQNMRISFYRNVVALSEIMLNITSECLKITSADGPLETFYKIYFPLCIIKTEAKKGRHFRSKLYCVYKDPLCKDENINSFRAGV